MRKIERVKIQRSLDQILAGNFHENQVDDLLIGLREYWTGHRIFREVADFRAHPKRNQGITVESLRRFCLAVKFATEYCLPDMHAELKFYPSIPLYLKYFVLFRVDDYTHNEIFQRFHLTPKNLKKHIQELFKDDEKTNTAVLKNYQVKSYTNEALDFLTKRFPLNAKPIFTSEAFMTDLLGVLHKNNFPIEKDVIMTQRAKIILCVMLLMHRSEFDFYGIYPVRCIISDSFGHLGVGVLVPFIHKDGGISWASYEIFSTDLSPKEFCDESLEVEESSPDQPGEIVRKLNFDQDLCLKNSKLSPIPS